MGRKAAIHAMLCMVLGGCVQDCSCEGCGSPPADEPQAAQTDTQAQQGPQPLPAHLRRDGGTLGQPFQGDGGIRPGPPPSYTQAPAGGLTDVLSKVRQETPWKAQHGDPVAAERLEGLLVEQLGTFQALGQAAPGPGMHKGMAAPSVTRKYEQGIRKATVTVTDTSLAYMLRDPVRRYLISIGSLRNGNQHGLLVKGEPALSRYEVRTGSSHAQVVVRNRYLVEAQVDLADDVEAASRLLEALDLTGLP